MSSLAERLNTLSLRQRFLIVPVVGLLVIVMGISLLALQIRDNDRFQQDVLSADLGDLNKLENLLIGLSGEHLSLFNLLQESQAIGEEALYEHSIKHLDRIRAINDEMTQALHQTRERGIAKQSMLGELARSVQRYQQQTSAAVELVTVDASLAFNKLVLANEAFVALARVLARALDEGREGIIQSFTEHKTQSRHEFVMVGVGGVLVAMCLLVLSLWLSRLLSAALDDQLSALVDLSRQAGAEAVPAGRDNPLLSMAGVIATFRESLFRLTASEASLARANAELHDHQSELEERISERTADLERAKDKAEVASVAKSTFLANMSHELRTPLNAILGYAQILAEDPDLDVRRRRGVNTIRQSGQHLLSVINEILDLSKIEAGKLELLPQAVNVRDLLASVVDIMQVRAQQGGIALKAHVPDDLPARVMVDEKRLRQVLLNLLGNAVKFTERGEVMLTASVARQSTAQVVLTCEVIDTGVGIAGEYLDTIFESFEQAGSSDSQAGGTGLGLAIVKQLVKLMGGDIEVSSELGRGSRFRFSIPVTVTMEDAAEKTSVAIPIGYSDPRRKILVVDDVAVNRMVQADMLAPLGFEVKEAGSGREALEIAATWQPDLITMDLVMPEMGGLEVIALLRACEDFVSTPILVISASASEGNEQSVLEAGANAFIQKPIQHDDFLKRIGELLHLQWFYEDASPGEASAQLLVPDSQDISALLKTALTGNMRDIRAHTETLCIKDPRYAPFADAVRELADNYQSKAIVQLLRRYDNNGEQA